MKRIGLYLDLSNLYFCVYNNSSGKLDYAALLEFIAPIGDVVIAKAYGAQIKDEAESFIKLLNNLGIQTFYKEPKHGHADHDVRIAVDIIRDLHSLDMVIIGTADGDLTPVVEYVREQGKDAVIIGSSISKELKTASTSAIELPASLIIPIRRKRNATLDHA